MSGDRRSFQVQSGIDQFSVVIQEDGAVWRAWLNGDEREIRVRSVDGRHHFTLLSGGESIEVYAEEIGDHYAIYVAGNVFEVDVTPQASAYGQPTKRAQPTKTVQPPGGLAVITAPMPGLVLQVSVKPGQQVGQRDTLLVLEAMKMENDIRAPFAGLVKHVDVRPGQRVDQGQRLAVIG